MKTNAKLITVADAALKDLSVASYIKQPLMFNNAITFSGTICTVCKDPLTTDEVKLFNACIKLTFGANLYTHIKCATCWVSSDASQMIWYKTEFVIQNVMLVTKFMPNLPPPELVTNELRAKCVYLRDARLITSNSWKQDATHITYKFYFRVPGNTPDSVPPDVRCNIETALKHIEKFWWNSIG